jgi:hypothetical protein
MGRVPRAMVRLFALLLWYGPASWSYSVLTHEAIIDSAWDANIKPVLLQRFSSATPEQLIAAHAHAYAGAIIQDLGYYPFGSKFFSDLVHYVRSGDFIVNLIRESQDLNEYAFALGALAHYAADSFGHSIAVNPSVAIEYPKLKRKYGSEVTYEDDPTAHIRVEFSFDVLQVARANYAPQAYHDFIGFSVAKGVLERAFRDTYSLEFKDVFGDVDLALGTYRHSVSQVIPEITRAAWKSNRKELTRLRPGLTRRQFVYNLSRASYRKEWDRKYEVPGLGTRLLAFFLRILPKIGPLKALRFKPPTPLTEKLFEESFNRTLQDYRALLGRGDPAKLQLSDRNFDTGRLSRPTEYRMADDAYARLAIKLSERDPSSIDPHLRDNLLAYFRDLSLPYATKKHEKEWKETLAALQKIKSQATVSRGPID